MMLVLHVYPLHPDAPATSEGVDRCLYLLPDLPPVQQDVAECLLGQNVSDCSLDQTLQHCGQTGYSWAAQCHVLYLVITHRAQLRPHQVLCHHLRTNIWEHTRRNSKREYLNMWCSACLFLYHVRRNLQHLQSDVNFVTHVEKWEVEKKAWRGRKTQGTVGVTVRLLMSCDS